MDETWITKVHKPGRVIASKAARQVGKFTSYTCMRNRARKYCRALQNKVRIKVFPEQLNLFVNTFEVFKK